MNTKIKPILMWTMAVLLAATLNVGCSDSTDSDVPPVVTAFDDMEALEKAAEEEKMAKIRENTAKLQAQRKADGVEPADDDDHPALDPNIPTTGMFVVDFETTAGNFTVTVHREWAPNGAARFYRLVKDKFYDEAAFFRVLPNFMAQFGIAADPVQTAKWNINIPDDPVKQSNTRGFVTFAKTNAPNSRSTQIFINFGNNARLDHDRFAPFGKVTKGMAAVDKISTAHGQEPNQGQITAYGNEYLKSAFLELDYITTARIVVDDLESSDAEGATEDSPAEDTAE